MQYRMQVNPKRVGLFLAGCIFGFGIVFVSRSELATTTRSAIAARQGTSGQSYESRACIPQSEDDQIFFITCGGIY